MMKKRVLSKKVLELLLILSMIVTVASPVFADEELFDLEIAGEEDGIKIITDEELLCRLNEGTIPDFIERETDREYREGIEEMPENMKKINALINGLTDIDNGLSLVDNYDYCRRVNGAKKIDESDIQDSILTTEPVEAPESAWFAAGKHTKVFSALGGRSNIDTIYPGNILPINTESVATGSYENIPLPRSGGQIKMLNDDIIVIPNMNTSTSDETYPGTEMLDAMYEKLGETKLYGMIKDYRIASVTSPEQVVASLRVGMGEIDQLINNLQWDKIRRGEKQMTIASFELPMYELTFDNDLTYPAYLFSDTAEEGDVVKLKEGTMLVRKVRYGRRFLLTAEIDMACSPHEEKVDLTEAIIDACNSMSSQIADEGKQRALDKAKINVMEIGYHSKQWANSVDYLHLQKMTLTDFFKYLSGATEYNNEDVKQHCLVPVSYEASVLGGLMPKMELNTTAKEYKFIGKRASKVSNLFFCDWASGANINRWLDGYGLDLDKFNKNNELTEKKYNIVNGNNQSVSIPAYKNLYGYEFNLECGKSGKAGEGGHVQISSDGRLYDGWGTKMEDSDGDYHEYKHAYLSRGTLYLAQNRKDWGSDQNVIWSNMQVSGLNEKTKRGNDSPLHALAPDRWKGWGDAWSTIKYDDSYEKAGRSLLNVNAEEEPGEVEVPHYIEGDEEIPSLDEQAGMNSRNWMAYLPNQLNLSMANLPMTHDSGTASIMTISAYRVFAELLGALSIVPDHPMALVLIPLITALLPAIAITTGPEGRVNMAPFAKDQNLSIPEQLNSGIRGLDIRLSNYRGATDSTDDLEVSHGGIRCLDEDGKALSMKKVLEYAKDFVKNNPSETVVIGMTNESFFAPSEVDIWIVNQLLQIGLEVLKDEIGSDDLGSIGKNAKPLIQKLLYQELVNDPDVIVISDKDGKTGSPIYPTVGEARGKVIVCDGDEYLPVTDERVGHWTNDGETKWKNLEAFFGDAPEQVYSEKNPEMRVGASSCTDSDGTYMLNAALALIAQLPYTGIVNAILEYLGVSHVDFVSGGQKQSNIVNPKLKEYDFKKGKRYGWLSMDFADEDLAKKIYNSNMFDFDVEGKPLKYISDIRIAFDQKYDGACETLEDLGYTVLDRNFNEEGPDKALSNAYINGIKCEGSFNLALGYKTTQNPLEAITGLSWAHRQWESNPMDEKTKTFLDENGFKIVDLAGTTIETDEIKSPEGFRDFNIGTKGYLSNLYHTKDQSYGERLITLESVQGYNNTTVDPMTGEHYEPSDIKKSKNTVADYFGNRKWEMPRDINEYVFASNYNRGLVNDVYLFYNNAFNDLSQPNYRFELFDGVHAGNLYQLKSGGSTGGGSGSSGGSHAEYKLTFDTNGGSEIKSISGNYGEKIDLNEYTPIKEGFIFDGWYSDKELTNSVNSVTLNGSKTVYAKWIPSAEEVAENNPLPFTDVKKGDWFYNSVKYVYDNELMKGTGDKTFEPLSDVTRGMFVTVLYRLAGEPAFMNDNVFDDVISGEYYEKAVVWAQGKDIVTGTTETTFEPDKAINREEMATMLYRYIKYNGGGFTGGWAFPLAYPDADKVSDWAYEPLCYLTMPSVGIMNGMEDGTLAPKSNTNRAELATILERFDKMTEE